MQLQVLYVQLWILLYSFNYIIWILCIIKHFYKNIWMADTILSRG